MYDFEGRIASLLTRIAYYDIIYVSSESVKRLYVQQKYKLSQIEECIQPYS